MNKILLVSLLVAAAACSKKGADCDTAIAKGMDGFTANMKEHSPNPQMLERAMGMVDKLKSTLITRCKEDSWPPEVTACFTTVGNRKDMQGCQTKLSPEQQQKLQTDLMQVMMGAGGMRPGGMGGMPPGMPGHPGGLAPNAPPAGGADPAAPPAPGAPGAPAGAPPAPPAAPAAPATPPAAPAAGSAS